MRDSGRSNTERAKRNKEKQGESGRREREREGER